jgi:hypothetical protein
MREDKIYGKTDFIVGRGFTQFNNPSLANDVSPYEAFDGNDDDYDSAVEFNDVPLELEFSDASGRRPRTSRRRKSSKSRFGIGGGRLMNAIEQGQLNRQKRFEAKQKSKTEELRTQKAITDQAMKAQEKDASLLSQIGLSNNMNLPEVNPKKDNSTRNLIIVGVLAVATLAGIYLYKKYKK